MPISELASGARFEMRNDSDGVRLTTTEHYNRLPQPNLLRVVGRADRASGITDNFVAAAQGARWRSDAVEGRSVTSDEVNEQLEHLGRVGTVATEFDQRRLLFLCAPDAQVPEIVRTISTDWLTLDGDPLALLIETDRACSARGSFMRGMFAAAHAPEHLTAQPFPGFESMRGLGGTQMEGPGGLVDPALLVHAPWVSGRSHQRAPGGLLVLLHDGVEFGRLEGSGELINAYRPVLLARPYREGLAQPTVSITDTEAFVRWWVACMDSFLSLALDPTLFRDGSGYYLPEHHLGFYNSVARLIGCVTAILVYTRRDDFARRLLFFEALDLLESFGFGAYDQTLKLGRLQNQLDALASVPQVRSVLPRCERAVEALSEVGDGFFETRRTADGGLLVRNSDGTEISIARHRAISQLVTTIRNAGHGFGGILNQDRDLSVLASHDGELSGDISDLVLLHFLTLLSDRTQLERALATRRY